MDLDDEETWLRARVVQLRPLSKERISAHQLRRSLNIDYKSALFLAHRIRRAMREAGLAGWLGGGSEIVDADEIY